MNPAGARGLHRTCRSFVITEPDDVAEASPQCATAATRSSRFRRRTRRVRESGAGNSVNAAQQPHSAVTGDAMLAVRIISHRHVGSSVLTGRCAGEDSPTEEPPKHPGGSDPCLRSLLPSFRSRSRNPATRPDRCMLTRRGVAALDRVAAARAGFDTTRGCLCEQALAQVETLRGRSTC